MGIVLLVLDLMHVHNFHYQMVPIIFGVDNSSSVHGDNKEKNILALGEVPTQRLDDTTITKEAKYSINFTESRKRFVLEVCTIMKATVSYLLMLQKYIISKYKFHK